MTDAPYQITRVVVLLDAAVDAHSAIETAARLAARARAPLHGVFVEDEDLLRLANLPFARQHTLGGAAEELTAEHVELHLKAAAERVRRDLVGAARRHRVEASFEIVRDAAASILVGAREGDLIVAGAMTRPIGAHFRVEHRWCSSLAGSSGPAFATHQGGDQAESAGILLFGERSDTVARLLEIEVAPVESAQLAEMIETYTCEILIIS